MGVTLTKFDSNPDPILDKSYGELTFASSVWGVNEDGSVFWNIVDLETHPCSEEELGVDSEQGTRFMPVHESSKGFV